MPPVWSAAGGLVIVIFLEFVICHLEFLLLKPESASGGTPETLRSLQHVVR
jgi:hypothetical protein